MGQLDRAALHAGRAGEHEPALGGEADRPGWSAPTLPDVVDPASMSADRGPHTHEAVFFTGTEDLVDAVAPALHAALETGNHVVLGCAEQNNRALRTALGDDRRIVHLPRSVVYKKAVTAVSYYRELTLRRVSHGSAGVLLLAQVDFGADPAAWDEWRRFEALCNRSLAGLPLWNVCAYDTQALREPVLATAELTHRVVRRPDFRGANPMYVDAAELLRLPASEHEPVPELEPAMHVRDVCDLTGLRLGLEELLRRNRVPAAAADDMVHAVHEIAGNAVQHGAPPVTAQVWLPPGRIVCTVTDQGPGVGDPLPGRLHDGADERQETGIGLWLARQCCDELVTMRNDEGFTVRVVKRR
jgi:anti-sigma regulatory factor (Ser/Thr protein kinase)